jgi:GT2 family glycosyltransferase
MSDNPVSVAVVVPVFNGSGFIGDCLESVRAQSVACSVIIVDDASTDDSAALIAQRFPEVALIRNPVNLGFAATVNLGLQRANAADFVFVLNQDTVLDQACVARLIDAFGALPGAGIMGCKILYPDGETVQHGGGWLRRPGAFGEHFGRGEPVSAGQDAPREVEFVTGAAIMLSRAALQVLGGLDTRLSTAYYEDTDLCFRARAAGLGVWYWPGAQLTHFEGSSIPKFSYQQHVYFHTGRTGFALRHWPPEDLVAFAWGEKEASAGSGSLDDVLARSRAYLTHLSNLAEARRVRDQIYAGAPKMRAGESVWAEVTQRLLDARESALKRAFEFLEITPSPAPIQIPKPEAEATGPQHEDPRAEDPAAERSPGKPIATDLAAPLSLPPIQLQSVPRPPTTSIPAPSGSSGPALAAQKPTLDLREFEFSSRVPVLGGLIAAIRRVWHGVSGRWALLHATRQQTLINHWLAAALDGLAVQLATLERERLEQTAATASATLELVDEVNRQARLLADAVDRQTARLADALAAQGAIQAAESAALRASLSALAETSDAFGEALAKQRRDTAEAAGALTAQLNGRLSSISAQLASQQARYDALFREATRHENDLIRNLMRGRGAAE